MQLLHALQDVRDIHRRIVGSKLFYGYSAAARLSGGVIALITASLLALLHSADPRTHFAAWGGAFALAVLANYFTLCANLKFSKERLLSEPVLAPLVFVLTGGIFTLTVAACAQFQLLFGVWMTFYGFANLAVKERMSREVRLVGCFYLAAGWFYLAALPFQNFLNPWPMGLVFFFGESAGAYAFYKHNRSGEEA